MSRFVRAGDLAAFLVLGLVLVTALDRLIFPATHWIAPHSVVVEDGVEGESVILRVDREIHRTFKGRYYVFVRSLPGHTAYCEASASIWYEPNAELPDPPTMEWWAHSDSRCHGPNMPAGLYAMKTCWTVVLPLWRSRETCIDSDPFEITPRPERDPHEL